MCWIQYNPNNGEEEDTTFNLVEKDPDKRLGDFNQGFQLAKGEAAI